MTNFALFDGLEKSPSELIDDDIFSYQLYRFFICNTVFYRCWDYRTLIGQLFWIRVSKFLFWGSVWNSKISLYVCIYSLLHVFLYLLQVLTPDIL